MSQTLLVAPWLMLFSRTVLFVVFQALIAVVLVAAGEKTPWHASVAWWTFSALFTNLVSIAALVLLFRREANSFVQQIRFVRAAWGQNLLFALGLSVLAIPIAMLPNLGLARLLFGSSEAVLPLMFRPLPLWAVLVSFVFPITQALAELPLYFAYVMPRLEKQLNNAWYAWGLASLFLALQHVGIPFILDWRFMLWRVGMFLPFALFLGACIRLRPRLLPYFMVLHALMDISSVFLILQAT